VNESLHALSGAYVVDALDDAERATFEQHLPGCLDCQREVAGLREATALLADDSALAPPASLRASVLSGIKTIRPLAPETGGQDEHRWSHPVEAAPIPQVAEQPAATVLPFRRRASRVTKLVAAAAAVAAIGAGIVYQPWQGNGDTPSATLSPADQVLTAPDAQKMSVSFKDGSSATVYRSVSEGHAVLLTRGMAAPPSGKTFELWLRNKAGVMKPAGLMTTGGDHKVLLKGAATSATGIGITVEPEGGSSSPSSAPIAMFELGQGTA
jgi:anti-sigma-K factor RskA